MKATKTVIIPVGTQAVGVLADPTGRNHTTYHALVRIGDLPLNMSLEINPRAQNTHSRVGRAISEGLTTEPENFYLRNRGLTIIAKEASYDAKHKQLVLEIPHSNYGVLDGGTTYAAIRAEIERAAVEEAELTEEVKESGDKQNIHPPAFLDGFVKLEVIVGVADELLVEISEARNTSIQVKEQSLINLRGSFDWLKEVLDKQPFGNMIAYRENEDDSKPIDIREVVCLGTLFHPRFQDVESAPLIGYTSRKKCLELFSDPEGLEGFKSLAPLYVEILKLCDFIQSRFPAIYQEIGGVMGIVGDEKKKTAGTKLAKVIGIKHYSTGVPLFYLGEKSEWNVPAGFIYPMLAAMRGIVGYNGTTHWKTNPTEFFNKVGPALVKMTLETSKQVGRRPNAVGKSRPHWTQLHTHVVNKYLTGLEATMRKAA